MRRQRHKLDLHYRQFYLEQECTLEEFKWTGRWTKSAH